LRISWFFLLFSFGFVYVALSGVPGSVMSLSDAGESLWLGGLFILVGNIFGVVLEGLLVFVQTTRLVLFEFFIRFLRAEGRLFRPVSGPSTNSPSARKKSI